jgi:hypothetical protein
LSGAAAAGDLPALERAQPRTEIAAAGALTRELFGLTVRYEHAKPRDRSAISDEMLAVVEARRELLAELIGQDPGGVLRLGLPQGFEAALPEAVRDMVEQHVSLEGDLEVLQIDGDAAGPSRILYFLNTRSGARLSLHFAANRPGLSSGTLVRANGLLLEGSGPVDFGATDGAMALESGRTSIEVLAAEGEIAGSAGAAAAASALPNTLGAQRTVVLLVNFQDNVEEPITPAQARSLLVDNADSFLLENSYGQTWLAADVFGWYTMPLNSAECSFDSIFIEGENAGQAHGIDLAATAAPSADWERSAAVRPKPSSRTWIGRLWPTN